MDDHRRAETHRGCPHVNLNDARCNSRFSLGRIDQAFCVCFGAFHACPMYHQINAHLAEAHRSETANPLVALTCDGLKPPLRATGS
jgi:hypothetical protein